MASLFGRVAKFASSPQGKQALNKAKLAANDPKNRAKLTGLMGKVRGGGKDGGKDGGAPGAGPTPPPTQP